MDGATEETSSNTDDVKADPGVYPVTPALPLQYAGRYSIEKQIGSGGFGRVYLARDAELSRLVAIKMPHVSDAQYIERDELLREARACAALEHSNIVPIYDVGETNDGLPFLVSKYMEGGALREQLQGGRFDAQTRGECTSTSC